MAYTNSPVVVGLGSTSFGTFPGEDAYSLGSKAFRAALSDAGLKRDAIDGLIVCRIPDYQKFGEIHGLNPKLAFNLPGQGRMAAVAMQVACQAIATGQCNTVALVYGNDGRTAGAKYGGAKDNYGGGGGGLGFPYGMSSPGAVHAMMFRRYASEFGVTEEDLAQIAVTFRHHASLNPGAVMQKPFTVADYMASRYIASPLRLLDYCLINDGGIALILTSAERTRDLAAKPVAVSGVAVSTRLQESTFPPDDCWYGPMRQVAGDLHQQTGLTPADMSGFMLYDNFTPTVLFSLDGFAICERGESAAYVRAGKLALGSAQPANTSGGHLSESYMQGWGLFAEAVRQLRGECGERQIPAPRHIQYTCASPICSSVIFSGE